MQKMKHFKRGNEGFTLIEIMVVVVILGILGALVVPNVVGRSGQAKVAAAKSDLNSLANALEMYKLDNGQYPSTDQGLEALISKPGGSPEPRNWNPQGYVKKLPSDPWDQSYLYINPGRSGSYDLYSLGADKKEGGEGENADIRQWEL